VDSNRISEIALCTHHQAQPRTARRASGLHRVADFQFTGMIALKIASICPGLLQISSLTKRFRNISACTSASVYSLNRGRWLVKRITFLSSGA